MELSSRLRWGTLAACALGAALALPEWVPHRLSREDGPIEWAGFACFAVAAALGVVVAVRARHVDRRLVVLALGFGLVMFVAAGEEISWGQRVLDLETPEVLVDGNRQDELNLHNIDGLQTKAVVAQLGVAAGGVLLPWVVRRRWARTGFPFFASYLAYRMGRVVVVASGGGAADRNSEAAELVLALGLVALVAAVALEVRAGAPSPIRIEGPVASWLERLPHRRSERRRRSFHLKSH